MAGKGIVMVICTFASDSQRGREYSGRSVDRGMERMGKRADQFVLMGFVAGADTVVEDSVVDLEAALLLAVAIEVRLNCRQATSSLR